MAKPANSFFPEEAVGSLKEPVAARRKPGKTPGTAAAARVQFGAITRPTLGTFTPSHPGCTTERYELHT
jgi:hypothetical protein